MRGARVRILVRFEGGRGKWSGAQSLLADSVISMTSVSLFTMFCLARRRQGEGKGYTSSADVAAYLKTRKRCVCVCVCLCVCKESVTWLIRPSVSAQHSSDLRDEEARWPLCVERRQATNGLWAVCPALLLLVLRR